MKTFWIRTASATVYAALFLGSIYSGQLLANETLGGIIFTAFLLFIACGCTFEFFRIVAKQGATPCRPLGYLYSVLGVVALSSIALFFSIQANTLFRVAMTLLPAAFGLAAIVQLFLHSEQPFRDAAYTMVPMLYAAVPLGLMPMLHASHNVLVPLIIMVWVNDSAAYMGGSLVGGRKLWARHSPGKTLSGALIGVAVTVVLAIFMGPLFNDSLAWYHWVVLAIICSVIDTLGDLVESMLKRSVGLKDSGNIMPGHGGFLDRFDSLLIIIPFAFAYITLASLL